MPARRPSFGTRLLGAFGLERKRPQSRNSMGIRANYNGAAGGRLFGDFRLATLQSADQVLRPDGLTLRARARELVINNSTAARVPALFSENIIGKDGIQMQARVKNSRGDFHATNNAKIEDAWYEWCEAETASADGLRCWTETETLIAESECTDGEVFLRHLEGFPNDFGYSTELIDPDQVDWNYNVIPGPGQNEIRMGVEMDGWGRRIAYHILTRHQGEGAYRRERVPATQIEHLFVQRRPRQTRGVTWFAPVIVDLNNLGYYREAELIAARTAAAKQGFLVKKTPDGDLALQSPAEGDADGTPRLQWDADPGIIEQLPDGWDFQGWDPTHPTTAFADFDKAILRSVASGVRVSYLSLSADLSDTSFGSGRIGMLGERAVYQYLQQRFIARIEQTVYRRWLKNALLSGALQLDSFDATRYQEVMWHPRSFPWIDPQKDLESKAKEVAIGVNTLTAIAAEQGRDLEEIFQTRHEEIALAEQYGVPLALDLRPVLTTRGNATLADQNVTDQSGGSETTRPNTQPEPGPQAPPANAVRESIVVNVAPPSVTINAELSPTAPETTRSVVLDRNAAGEVIGAEVTDTAKPKRRSIPIGTRRNGRRELIGITSDEPEDGD